MRSCLANLIYINLQTEYVAIQFTCTLSKVKLKKDYNFEKKHKFLFTQCFRASQHLILALLFLQKNISCTSKQTVRFSHNINTPISPLYLYLTWENS